MVIRNALGRPFRALVQRLWLLLALLILSQHSAWAMQSWSSWDELGAPPESNPGRYLRDLVVGQNADGRLEIFASATVFDQANVRTGHLWHRWQTQPNGDWTNWSMFGGSDDKGTRLAVGQNQDGRLEVFRVGTDKDLWHRWQTQANGDWGEWVTFGSPPGTSFVGDVEVERNEDGRLEVFVSSDDATIWHRWQVEPNGKWSGWAWLERPGDSSSIKDIEVGKNPLGKLELFVLATNGNVWHQLQLVPLTNGWGQWVWFWIPFDESSITDIELGTNSDGRLELFASASDGTLRHRWQVPAGPPTPGPLPTPSTALVPPSDYTWSEWTSLGSPPGMRIDKCHRAIGSERRLGSGRNADGRLEVFASAADGGVWHIWQQTGGSWSGWVRLESPSPPVDPERLLCGPVAAENEDGRLEVFAESTQCPRAPSPLTCGRPGSLWHARQLSPTIKRTSSPAPSGLGTTPPVDRTRISESDR